MRRWLTPCFLTLALATLVLAACGDDTNIAQFWRPISEPLIIPMDGGKVFWIEDGDRWRTIPDPGPDSDISCFSAFYDPCIADIRRSDDDYG